MYAVLMEFYSLFWIHLENFLAFLTFFCHFDSIKNVIWEVSIDSQITEYFAYLVSSLS